jgi:diadenosine tetraphosphate (Ap4A) HIT family hydrolase
MCIEGRPDRIPHGLRVYRGRYLDAYLSTKAAQRGYVVAIWRGQHINDLTELSTSELTGYWSEVAHVSTAVQRHYRPRKVNYEVLGNQMPHLHTHITARFAVGDVAPGHPLPQQRELSLPSDVVDADLAALARLLTDGTERP